VGYRLGGYELAQVLGVNEIIIRDAWRTRKNYDISVARGLIKDAGYDYNQYDIKETVLQEGEHEFDAGGGKKIKQYGYLVRLSIVPKSSTPSVPGPSKPPVVKPRTFLDDLNDWFKSLNW